MTADPFRSPVRRPFGFNLIGHVTGNLGLGVAARTVARAIVAKGYPLAVHDVEVGGARGGRDREFDAHGIAAIDDLPYAINVFVVGVDTLKRLLERHASLLRADGCINAAVCFWELPTLPPRWLPLLDTLDVVVAASDFMRYAFQFSLSGPSVIAGRLPVDIPEGVVVDRARFDLPDDAVVFVTGFEPFSDPARKNTFAVIDAFRRGATDRPQARLVVNVNNAFIEAGREHEIVAALRDRCGDDDRIVVLTAPLDYRGVLSLYRSCDVYVSLHRAEGLGLGMAESMMLGKPVIATGWSGNLTFMDHLNACLVGYRLIAVQGMTPIYSHDHLEDTTQWADPDVDEASAWMTRLLDDAALRRSIGTAASASMRAYNDDAHRATYLRELQAIWESRETRGVSPGRHAVDPLVDRTRLGRLAKIQALERELTWIKSRPLYRLAAAAKALASGRKPDA